MLLNNKKEQGKRELLATLKYNPIIPQFSDKLVEDYKWAVQSDGYYDSNRRYLLFSGDFIGAFFDGVTNKQLSVEMPKESVFLRYPEFGYYPIRELTLPSGISLREKDILDLLARVMIAEMKDKIPTITRFSDPYESSFNNLFCVRVDYELQSVTLKNWFDY